ncbi:ATP-dependent helicase [Alkalicoccobacillus murimartini]|uniref:DNA 3'-5' helicase n=1 Tax=Alkalicoccobacillus murimartini TaxID=171685 RepID=A0ABT9YMD3_9BACI|nr:ATP-dependent helicase [Alkalicoccobacillus murimartini]MDQ0209012.1 DNA helicase-2/ATP-dependent DNA helicase PcrA [Alkalicoccobacillus murimartini]
MQIAFYQHKLTNLTVVDRSEWQRIYQACKRGEVTCAHCQEPVRMQMSIQQAPFFEHPRSLFDCAKQVEQLEQAKAPKEKPQPESAGTSVGGFVLPKGRSIESQASTEPVLSWKEPEQIRAFPEFIRTPAPAAEDTNAYRGLLEQSGIILDSSQWRAVTKTEGPLLLVAGAGSGKTRVLTSRAAYMLVNEGIPPQEMILVTFTAKAAKEMKERMKIYPGIDKRTLQKLMIGTFHSIFYKMLIHHEPETWDSRFLLKEWQRSQMLKEAGREMDLEEKEFAYDQALTQISWWKNHLITPKDVKPADIWEERCAYLYRRYEEIRISRSAFDFDDMLTGCYELLLSNPVLLERYQKRFSYVSVDEFQDINKIQFKLIQLLCEPQRNLCVVGDDDQSIYAFRGSDPDYLRSFSSLYPEGQTIILNQNYRSSHPIVSVANNVVTSNKQRVSKQLQAQSTSDTVPFLFFPYDEEEEATMIVTDIKERIENGATPSDFAILYRTNVHSMALFERLIQSSIPFVVEQDGDSFYKRKVVRKALSYLRISQHPDDTEAMTDLIGALFLKQERLTDIKRMSILHDCSLLEALKHLDGLKPFQLKKLEELPNHCKEIRTASPETALGMIEKELGFKDYLKKQGNEGNKMDKGSDDLARLKVSARQHNTIESFLQHVNHIIAKQDEKKKQPIESNAVQLMTIHRSKGLEFKTVYILGAVEGSMPHDYALEAWRDGDDQPLEEERRLMYVAMTRAEQHLAISVPMMYRGKRAQRSRFVREMSRRTAPLTRNEVTTR